MREKSWNQTKKLAPQQYGCKGNNALHLVLKVFFPLPREKSPSNIHLNHHISEPGSYILSLKCSGELEKLVGSGTSGVFRGWDSLTEAGKWGRGKVGIDRFTRWPTMKDSWRLVLAQVRPLGLCHLFNTHAMETCMVFGILEVSTFSFWMWHTDLPGEFHRIVLNRRASFTLSRFPRQGHLGIRNHNDVRLLGCCWRQAGI